MTHFVWVIWPAFIALILLVYVKRYKKYRMPLPPGPKKLPFIGNLFDMPKTVEWETYHKWSKEFNSDVIHLNVMGTSIVVLDTVEAAIELLEKRSSIYSGRPRMPMVSELMGWDFHFGLMPYGNTWRRHRKLAHHAFNSDASREFEPIEIRTTHGFLRRLLHDPSNFTKDVRHLTAENILSIAYGIDILPKDDPYIKMIENAVEPLVKAMMPGAFLVDQIPALKYVPEWMPFAGFKRKAREWQKITLRMIDVPFAVAKQRIDDGNSSVSLVSVGLEDIDENHHDLASREYDIKSVAGSMYSAGSDTSFSAILTTILALILHPEVLKKAQQEIDSVIGPSRLPTFEDRDSLPYITAIIKECVRWREITPIGVPHFLHVDDEYKGYRIPAGSIIIVNVWAMLHNDTVYPEPFKFNPDRFMKDGKINPAVTDPEHALFGFGRRICPGRFMASSVIWITIASLIAAFDITKALDQNGNPIEPSQEYGSGLARIPLPFECSIKPRSKEAEALILATDNN